MCLRVLATAHGVCLLLWRQTNAVRQAHSYTNRVAIFALQRLHNLHGKMQGTKIHPEERSQHPRRKRKYTSDQRHALWLIGELHQAGPRWLSPVAPIALLAIGYHRWETPTITLPVLAQVVGLAIPARAV